MKRPDNKMNLREIRDRLHELAKELAFLAEETRQRKTLRRAARYRRRMNPLIVRLVKRDLVTHPHLSRDQIGSIYEVDGGRVTEIEQGWHDDRL